MGFLWGLEQKSKEPTNVSVPGFSIGVKIAHQARVSLGAQSAPPQPGATARGPAVRPRRAG